MGNPRAEYSGAGDFGVLGSSYDDNEVKVRSPSVLARPSIEESLSLSISFILWARELNDPMLSASEWSASSSPSSGASTTTSSIILPPHPFSGLLLWLLSSKSADESIDVAVLIGLIELDRREANIVC